MPGFTSYEFVVQKLEEAPGLRSQHDIKDLDIYFRRKSNLFKTVPTGTLSID